MQRCKADGDGTEYTPNEYLWQSDELMHTGKACHKNCWNLIKNSYGIKLTFSMLGSGCYKLNHYSTVKYGNNPGYQYGYELYNENNAYMWKNPLKNKRNKDRILALQLPFLQ